MFYDVPNLLKNKQKSIYGYPKTDFFDIKIVISVIIRG